MADKTHTIYDPATGRVLRVITCPEQMTHLQFDPETHAAVEGATDATQYYIEGGKRRRIRKQPSTAHVFDWQTKRWRDPRSIKDVRATQAKTIDAAFDKAAASLTIGYPGAERLTWPLQQSEVLAWAADPQAPTPFLDGLAAARGIEPEAMRAKALAAVRAFMAEMQRLIGIRKRLQAALAKARSRKAIEAVLWP